MAEGHEQERTAIPGEGFDRQDPNARLIGLLGLATVAVLAGVVLALQYYYDTVREQQVYIRVLAPESEELMELRAREDAQLHSYEYIDREKGLVRLPVERAMELLAAESAAGAPKYATVPYPVKKEGVEGDAGKAAP
jgi:hypothetical protein